MADIRNQRGRTAELEPYIKAWRDKMVEIWRDRLDLLGVHDTGALRRSVQEGQLSLGDARADMAFRFLEYGIYVDLGVGNGYRHDNGGRPGIPWRGLPPRAPLGQGTRAPAVVQQVVVHLGGDPQVAPCLDPGRPLQRGFRLADGARAGIGGHVRPPGEQRNPPLGHSR